MTTRAHNISVDRCVHLSSFSDSGARLRESFRQRAIQQGLSAAEAERAAAASGFRSALDGLPVYEVDENGKTTEPDPRVALREQFKARYLDQGLSAEEADRRAKLAVQSRGGV